MKRFLALLLALGILVAADRTRHVVAQDDKKDKEEKKDKDKKDDKKDKDKDDKDKDKDDKDKDKEKPKETPLTEAQKKELEKFTGTYEVIEFERDGKKSPADELKKMKIIHKAGEWSFHLGDDVTQGKDTPFPDKNPKEIDSLYTNGLHRDKVVKGIYKIEDDTITFCWAEPGKDRPKEFKTTADSGLTVFKMKKTKEDAKKDKDKEEKKDKDKDEKKDKKDDKKDKDKDEKDKDKKKDEK